MKPTMFRSLHMRAAWASRLLAASAVTTTLLAMALSGQDRFLLSAAVVAAVCNVSLVVVFLAWWYRAFANLTPLGATDLYYTPGWAVASFFIPFGNWVMPPKAAGELWKGTFRAEPDAWDWFVLRALQVGWFCSSVVTTLGRANPGGPVVEFPLGLAVALLVVGEVLAMWFVHRITTEQERRHSMAPEAAI